MDEATKDIVIKLVRSLLVDDFGVNSVTWELIRDLAGALDIREECLLRLVDATDGRRYISDDKLTRWYHERKGTAVSP